MLSQREAFKIGFLTRCAALGLTQDETIELAKTAAARVKAGFLDKVWQGVKDVGNVVRTAGGVGLAGLALAPPALGYAGGYGLGRATDIDDEDVDAIQQRELIDELLRQKARLEHRNRRYRVRSG